MPPLVLRHRISLSTVKKHGIAQSNTAIMPIALFFGLRALLAQAECLFSLHGPLSIRFAKLPSSTTACWTVTSLLHTPTPSDQPKRRVYFALVFIRISSWFRHNRTTTSSKAPTASPHPALGSLQNGSRRVTHGGRVDSAKDTFRAQYHSCCRPHQERRCQTHCCHDRCRDFYRCRK